MEIRARAFAVLIIKDAINLIDVISEVQCSRENQRPSFTTTIIYDNILCFKEKLVSNE
jgi:hypothetical protein